MKHRLAILSLGLVISACTATKPAPYELKGTKFYGKGQQNEEYVNQGSDSDVVYKGRSGESADDKSYSSDYNAPKYRSDITKKPLDSGIRSEKLAPPSGSSETSSRSGIDDNIDQAENDARGSEGYGSRRYNSSRMTVPTTREEPVNRSTNLHEGGEDDVKSTSSDYLDLSSVDKHPSAKQREDARPQTTAKSEPTYDSARTDKLRGIEPKEKPAAFRTADSKHEEHAEKTEEHAEKKESSEEDSRAKRYEIAQNMDVAAKEKPKAIAEKEKPKPKEEAHKEAEEKTEKAEKPIKVEKTEKAAAKPAKTLEDEDITLNAKGDANKVTVPEKPPVAKAEVKKPEVKKTEEKNAAKAEAKKPEIASEVPEEEVALPVAEAKKQDIASIPKMEPASTGALKFIKPTEGKIIKEFGPGNDGITIQAPEGTPVKAAAGGEVVYSGNQLQGYGNMIVIKHPNGFLTAYSHLDNLSIKKGTKVDQGEVIGKVGKTGNVATPQLHFGVRKGRAAVNPRDYL